MFGKWHLGFQQRFNPVNRGFDAFYGFLGGSHGYFPAATRGNKPRTRGRDVPRNEAGRVERVRDRRVRARGRRRSSAGTAASRFFVYLPFNAVHTPLQATHEYLRRFRTSATRAGGDTPRWCRPLTTRSGR
jgi:arylsulfatase A-like enzyme